MQATALQRRWLCYATTLLYEFYSALENVAAIGAVSGIGMWLGERQHA